VSDVSATHSSGGVESSDPAGAAADRSAVDAMRRRWLLGGSLAALVAGAELVARPAGAATGTTAWLLGGNTGVNTDGSNYLGTRNVAPLVFKTAATAGTPLERMRITPGGLIGVGLASPLAQLHVRSTGKSPAVFGQQSSTSATQPGVRGHTESTAAGATGVFGVVAPTSPHATSAAVRGTNNGTNSNGYGVFGSHASAGTGVHGQSSPNGIGVSGNGYYGLYGTGTYGGFLSGGTYGCFGSGTYGVYGSGSYGCYGSGTYGCYGSGSSYGVYGTSGSGFGVRGNSTSSVGVAGYSSSSNAVQGVSTDGPGIFAQSTNSSGVDGRSTKGNGVQGISSSGTGVLGQSSTGYAGFFFGNVGVQGTLSKSAGSFVIDHPLEPATKTLTHSFVESDEMKNVYDGAVTTDASGYATVKLPTWFEALNKDFRYQLTAVGRHEVWIEKELSRGAFVVGSGSPRVKVFWQVTGVRQDAYANAHRLPVESDKPKEQRGKYLHPELFGHGVQHRMTSVPVGEAAMIPTDPEDQPQPMDRPLPPFPTPAHP
jgi:hypothetical protein